MGADPTGGNSSSFSFDGARSFFAIIISLATLCFHFERVYVRRVTPVLSILKTTANLSRHDPDPRRFRRGYDALAQLFQRRLRGVLFFYFRNFVHVFQRNRPLDFVPWPLPPPRHPRGFPHEVRHRRSSHLPLEGFVFVRGDDHGNGRVGVEISRLGVEGFAKLHDVQPVLPQRGTHGGGGFSRARGDHQLDFRQDRARHCEVTRIEKKPLLCPCRRRSVRVRCDEKVGSSIPSALSLRNVKRKTLSCVFTNLVSRPTFSAELGRVQSSGVGQWLSWMRGRQSSCSHAPKVLSWIRARPRS